MDNEINLTIAVPSKIYLEEKVASVIVPAVRAAVNILPSRAPSVFVLDFGVLEILNDNGGVKKRYFVQSGMAEVVGNNCKVMVQGIVPFEEVDLRAAQKQIETAENEQEKLFYQMILDYQKGIRRRYLRTLNMFSRKSRHQKTYDEVISEIKYSIDELRKKNDEKDILDDEG